MQWLIVLEVPLSSLAGARGHLSEATRGGFSYEVPL